MTSQETPAHPVTMEAQAQAASIANDALTPTPIVTTKRLNIRPMHRKDAASMQRVANDPEVLKYMSLAFSYPYSIEHANTWVTMNLGYAVAVNFVICEAHAPEIAIGGIGFKPGSDVTSHTAEVGYWIGRDFWGRGLITEALEAITAWGFESYVGKDGQRLKRLWGAIFAPNVGSMRCFEKCGYVKEGVLVGHAEKYGVIMDEHVYGLTKSDWEKNRK